MIEETNGRRNESEWDSRLADYLAGDMSPSEEQAFLREAEKDPALAGEIASLIRARDAIGMLRALPETEIRAAASSSAAAPPKPAATKRFLLAACLAASLLLAFFAGFQAGGRAPSPTAPPASASLDPPTPTFEAAFGRAWGDLPDQEGLARSWMAFSRALSAR